MWALSLLRAGEAAPDSSVKTPTPYWKDEIDQILGAHSELPLSVGKWAKQSWRGMGHSSPGRVCLARGGGHPAPQGPGPRGCGPPASEDSRQDGRQGQHL